MINTIETKFFNENLIILNELSKYAPPDNKLLHFPRNTNISDRLLKSISQLPNNPEVNNFLIGLHLSSLFQSVNRVLSKVYAAHQYIIEKRNQPINTSHSQSEIDSQLYKSCLIFQEYNTMLREFISLLRMGIDQLIMLLTTKLPQKCDCIGKYLNIMEKSDEKQNYDEKFLSGLNAAANYLKHHPYQLEDPASTFHLFTPSLLVMVSKNKKNHDYKNLCKFFSNELTLHNDFHVLCWISCDFLVNGFNYFYKQLTEKNLVNVQNISPTEHQL